MRELLRGDLRDLRAAHSWHAVAALATTLERLDGDAPHFCLVRAEALARVGQRPRALDVLETLLRERSDLAPAVRDEALRLRARISKTGDVPRDSTLRGRDECLAFLKREWECSSSGGARLCTLLGAPGIGKTRVATEFATSVALGTGRVIQYRCDVHTRAQPLALFSAVLPALRQLRGSLGVSPRHLELLDRLQYPSHPAHAEAGDTLVDYMRAEFQRALVDLFEAVTSEQHVLLVVDDAQFLDDSSSVVLTHLCNSVNSAALLVVACRRPGNAPGAVAAIGERSECHVLTPLNAADALLVVQELDSQRLHDEAELALRVAQAAGNPFYLRAVALHQGESAVAPVDIRSLAVGIYTQLTPDAKTVLEACLLLKKNATISRVGIVSAVNDDALLQCFRHLEEADLIRMSGQSLVGPHDLLQEELLQLIPTSVCAMLQRRIAATLESDCIAEQFAPELAWAAAQSWMALGDHSAATALVLRCAEHAASLGEPAAAVDLLTRVDRTQLPPSQRAVLCEALAAHAQRGGIPALAASVLGEALNLARASFMSATRIAQLEVAAIEANLLNGGDSQTALASLLSIVDDTTAPPQVRVRAGLRMMVLADVGLDVPLAELARERIGSIPNVDADNAEVNRNRASLVYHTTFGDPELARAIAVALLQRYPEPVLSCAGSEARHFVAFAFYRMRDCASAIPICEADFDFFMQNAVRNQALYVASLRTDIAIEEGDFEGAEAWLARSQAAAHGSEAELLSPGSGHTANAGMLALIRGEYAVAEILLQEPLRQHSLVRSTRFRAIYLALSLRVRCRRGDDVLPSKDVEELERLYELGSRLGGQDAIVAVLWCAKVLCGKEQDAADLLRTYLLDRRRERYCVDWFLSHTTMADPTWQLPAVTTQARYAI
ncbi:MAG: ATP-binding protein [Gemmatimonadota bacterium]